VSKTLIIMHTHATAAAISLYAPKLWSVEETLELFEKPFMDLLWHAQQVHREHFDANRVQRSALFSIKTGGCSEDCKYCSQSARHDT
ncbi:hypothetical protein ACS2UW_27000, partial [Bacillus cereus group sp. BC318]